MSWDCDDNVCGVVSGERSAKFIVTSVKVINFTSCIEASGSYFTWSINSLILLHPAVAKRLGGDGEVSTSDGFIVESKGMVGG